MCGCLEFGMFRLLSRKVWDCCCFFCNSFTCFSAVTGRSNIFKNLKNKSSCLDSSLWGLPWPGWLRSLHQSRPHEHTCHNIHINGSMSCCTIFRSHFRKTNLQFVVNLSFKMDCHCKEFSIDLPYTCRWCRVTWAFATCPHSGGWGLLGPCTSAWCHTTGCQPGRGPWCSAGNIHPPPLLCTRTSRRGTLEASSLPPPPGKEQAKGKKKKKKLKRIVTMSWFYCEHVVTAYSFTQNQDK